MKITLLLVWIASLSLLGCAAPGGGDSESALRFAESTGSSARAIRVFVVADADSEDLSIDEEPIHRKKMNKKDIDFVLPGGSGYKFPADAVTFDDQRYMPAPGEITCTTLSDTKVNCVNKHNDHGKTYKYTLRVKSDATGAVLTLDPFIINH